MISRQLNSQKKTLQHQQSTHTHKTIPKQRLPILPTVLDKAAQTELTKDFNKQYEKLYFSFLDRVITQNAITLEHTKQKLDNIVTATEQYLCSLSIPQTTLQNFHSHFLSQCKLSTHNCSPQLQKKLTTPQQPETTQADTSVTTQGTPTTGNKRKPQEQQPDSTKRPKTDASSSFLCLGPPLPTSPT